MIAFRAWAWLVSTMKLNSKSLYSLHFLTALAVEYEKQNARPIHLRQIAEEFHIPFKFLEQLAILLKSVGLVRGARGKSGGYQLSFPPEEITLSRILLATEGEFLPCAEIEGGNASVQELINGLFADVRKDLKEKLDNITLTDLANKVKQEAEPAYMYYL